MLLALGSLASGVVSVPLPALAQQGAGDGDPHRPPNPAAAENGEKMREVREREEARKEKRKSKEAKDERKASRTKYKAKSRSEALSIAKEKYPSTLETPVWEPIRPRDGERVDEYKGDHAALIEKANGKKVLAESFLPMRSDVGTGELRRVSLELEESEAGYASRNPLVAVELPGDLADGIRLPDLDLSVRPGNAADADSPLVTRDKLFYANTGVDTDLLVVPSPTGFQLVYHLRSEDSPEEASLTFTLPTGAELRMAEDASGAAEIVRGDERLAFVTPPLARDVEGEPLETTLAVAGSRLVVRFAHRNKDLAYPVEVDPVLDTYRLVDGQKTGAWDDFGGWTAYSTNSLMKGNPNYDSTYGNGLYNFTEPASGGTWYGDLWYHEWVWYAPRQAFIERADFGYVNHEFRESCVIEGLWAGSRNNWDYGHWDHPPDQPTPQGPSPWAGWNTAPPQYYGDNRHACSPLNNNYKAHYPDNPTAGNAMVFGLQMAGSHVRYSRALAYMYGAAMYLNDRDVPYITSTAEATNNNWEDDGNRSYTFRVNGWDQGLGIRYFQIYQSGGVTLSWQDPNSTRSGNGATADQGCVGHRFDRCPDGWTVDYTYRLPEGQPQLSLVPYDVLSKAGNAQTWSRKIDRSNPSIGLSGPLADNDGRSLSGDTYRLTAAAQDQYSGGGKVEVFVDNVSKGLAERTTACDGCDLTLNFDFNTADYREGKHTIRVEARDRLNHAAPNRELYVIVDREPPALDATTHDSPPPTAWIEHANRSVTATGSDHGSGVKYMKLVTPRRADQGGGERTRTASFNCEGSYNDRCPTGPNLLGPVNWSFERGFTDWNVGAGHIGWMTFSPLVHGARHLSFRRPPEWGTGDIWLESQQVDAVAGRTYRASVYARPESGNTPVDFKAEMVFFDSSRAQIAHFLGQTARENAPLDWKASPQVSAVAPSGTRYVAFRMAWLGALPGQWHNADAARLEDMSAATATKTIAYDVEDLPEGAQQPRVLAEDGVARVSKDERWTLKIDRSIPSPPVLSGPLLASGEREPGTAYQVTATGDDAYSGVQTLRLKIDGQEQQDSYRQRGCSADPGCSPTSWSQTWTVVAPNAWGNRSAEVVATDALGHVSSAGQATFRVRDKGPPDLRVTGGLRAWPAITGRTLTATATDPDAGVRDIRVYLKPTTQLTADQTEPDPATQVHAATCLSACSGASGFSTTYRLPDNYATGRYQFVVRATDINGNQAEDRWVVAVVQTRAGQRARLGLEQWFELDDTDAGGDSSLYVNGETGNLVWHQVPIVNPGRGLSTVVNLSYNSQDRGGLLGIDLGRIPLVGSRPEDDQVLGVDPTGLAYREAGVNFSVGIGGPTRVNEPLSGALDAARIERALGSHASAWPLPESRISLTDADGTQHVFTRQQGQTSWQAPPGLNLRLRWIGPRSTTTPLQPLTIAQLAVDGGWELLRPDGVRHIFDTFGYLQETGDRNGNRLDYVYRSVNPITGGECASDALVLYLEDQSQSTPALLRKGLCVPQLQEVRQPAWSESGAAANRRIRLTYTAVQQSTLADLFTGLNLPDATGLPNTPPGTPTGTLVGAGFMAGEAPQIDKITDASGRVYDLDYYPAGPLRGYLKDLTENSTGTGDAETGDTKRTTRFKYDEPFVGGETAPRLGDLQQLTEVVPGRGWDREVRQQGRVRGAGQPRGAPASPRAPGRQDHEARRSADRGAEAVPLRRRLPDGACPLPRLRARARQPVPLAGVRARRECSSGARDGERGRAVE